MLTPANPEAEQAVLSGIMEQEIKVALNPQLAFQFLGPIYATSFASTMGRHLLVGGAE